MLRKVIKTEEQSSQRTTASAFSRKDTLECGHIIHNKGSAGKATKRKCNECQSLQGGATLRYGNVVEKWDSKTKMPVRSEYESNLGL